MKLIRNLASMVGLLAALGAGAMAQDVIQLDAFDFENVEPFGNLETVYEPYDNPDAGAIVLSQSTPDDQHANFDVVGPNGFWRHFDFSDDPGEKFVLDALTPGVYSIAATDEGLELAHTIVEVRLGETATVHVSLNFIEEAVEAGGFDPYRNYGRYTGFEDNYPGYPYGSHAVGPYETYASADLGAIAIIGLGEDEDVEVIVTGPNGYSEAFDEDTFVEGLIPGVYVIAASGEGTDVSVTTVEVRIGQQLSIAASMSPLE